MNSLALIFFLLCAGALLFVPRKWAPAALLVGCTYIPLSQGIDFASVWLPILRLMLLVGVARVLVRGERLIGGLNTIDKMLIAWGAWVLIASLFHDPERHGLIYASGAVFNLTLIYFLIRIWCTDLREVQDVILVVALLLVPIAVEMSMEKATGKNLFSVFGGVSENVQVREGKLRAQGPFLHAILAGTVGAACVPLFIGLFLRFKLAALVGVAAGIAITFASASSGPVMTLLAAVGAMLLWQFKHHLSKARFGGVLLYLMLMVTMSRPPYYLIGEIDITGGSTGWHRANLIEMTFKHLSEWWLFGTDHTRHWMPWQGIGSDPNHTDITNYYIGMGVFAGLPAMLLVIAIFLVAFRWVGQILDARIDAHPEQAFMIWCFGASLFAHAVTGISVAYFDQSVIFLWLTIAVISSTHSIVSLEANDVNIISLGPEDSPELSEIGQDMANTEWRRKYRELVIAGELSNPVLVISNCTIDSQVTSTSTEATLV